MSLTAGTRLGTYEIVAPLGAGGMGEVYRAKDLRLGREVALKVLPESLAGDADHLARFEREARTVAGLNHPNIVTLHSVEDEDETRFLTMELVEGRSLSDLVEPGGLSLARVLEMAIAIADALAAAHQRGVVHRDLKPANVMVTLDGRVKVLDFGLARPATAHTGAQAPTVGALSGIGLVAGTVPYMAPEQIRAEAVDARTDLFAFGIVLYEMLTGRRPFAGSNGMVVSAAILNDAPEALANVRTDLPGAVERLVSRCLEKDPGKRIQSAREVGDELRHLRRTLEGERLTELAPGGIASIAVLPFVNRSRDEDDEYFSDGLADELLHVLARIRGLRVAARTSSFHFKGKDTTIAEVGAALHVATVLEGSVRKAGGRVRISVQLVKVSDGFHLWSETYDRTLDDILAVQDDIAQSVVKELRVTLLGEEADSGRRARADVANAVRGRSTDPEAHRLYLLARHLNDRVRREETAKAIEYLKQALARDPGFALAWAELGASYGWEAGQGAAPVAEGFERAREAVERALALEPNLPEAHVHLGWIRMVHDWDWRGAAASIDRALELAPGNALALRRAAFRASCRGRSEEAIGWYRRSLEQDPLSSGAYNHLGQALQAAGRSVEAEAAFRRALELAPQMALAHAYLAFTLASQGRGEEALAEATREPEEALRLWASAIVHSTMGHDAESVAALRELIGKYSEEAAYQVAEVHGSRGEVDAAFDWLQRAHAQRDGGLSEMLLSPPLVSLHRDPRWAAFSKKMGFED